MNKTAMIAGLAASILGSLAAFAQSPRPSAMFPFVLPWSDSAPGTATDVSFLNTRPAGANGPIVSRDGHFIEANTGKRIRFLGTNFAAKAAFPSHADAEKVAARIAKLGINLVRMHHMDNVDWGQESSIWDYSYKDRQHISAAQLDRLDYLVAQLKKQGIYVNLNLHVSRQFSEADGFPASIKQIAFGYDKRVDEFDSRMIQLQKHYAHDLLTHVNPYTGLAYASDPAVAMVEINNENSLVGDPWASYGADLQGLPEPFRGELTGMWNGWLTAKYSTDAALLKAWMAGITPTGPELLRTTSWSDEHQGTSDAVVTLGHTRIMSRGAPIGPTDIHVDVRKTDGTDWHVQVHQTGIDLRDGATYTVSFRARADRPREMPVNCGLDEADWHNIGLNATAKVGPDWKSFRYSFAAHDVVAKHARIAFVLGAQTGEVWIEDLHFHAGAEGAGLQQGESLAARNVGIPESALRAQHSDWIEFLADTERSYADSMRAYIKDELHFHANVICSQVSWGGLTGIRRESDMDFADNHAYWQHPSFPGKPWDPENWYIENTPMVTALANGGGTLKGLAEYRIAGKPYTISEYNHPAPNDYRAECTPILATFAAIQDWDAIYLFDYGDYGTGVKNDQINGYFGISSDPAKTAFLPAAAMIFRAAEIPACDPAILDISISALSQATGSLWNDVAITALYSQAISVRPILDPKWFIHRKMPRAGRMDRTHIETRDGKAVYMSEAPCAVCLVGYVGSQQFIANGFTANFPTFGNNFAAVTLTAMDGKPIRTSERMLLTLVGKVENQDMVWNTQRTSVGSHWGHGPTIAEGIPAAVTIATNGARRVWALDGSGKRVEQVPATLEGGKLTFTVGPKYRTLWYEIAE